MGTFRLVVMGDPHVCPEEERRWDEAIEDINGLRPDAVMVLGKRMVPRDPATMRQGPGHARSSRAIRFAFLSDMHVVSPIGGVQQRLIDWCLRRIKEQAAERVVLGGDLTHHADPKEAEELLMNFVPGVPIDYLPGNNEGNHLAIELPHPSNPRMISGGQAGGKDWPGHVFLLGTSDAEDAAAAVKQLAAQWPAEGNVLILAHFPPEMTGGEMESLAASHRGQKIFWFCGHRHAHQEHVHDNLHVTVCAGLDPVKARGQLPEMLMIDWDGVAPIVQRLQAPEAVLHPARFQRHPIGLAFRGSAREIVEAALEHGITCVQFHYSFSKGEPSDADRQAVGRFRRQFPDGFLSLHLPSFKDEPDGPVSPDLEAALQWAQGVGVNDLTVHLPAVPVEHVFDESRQWRSTPWVEACLVAYETLAEKAIAIGAQLSLENLYNKQPCPPMPEKLSSRPWHLIQFVATLRSRLEKKGYTPEQAQRVGIIFDAGHAFRDAAVARIHGLADWIHLVGPYLQLAHIHQVGLSPDGTRRNHQPITDRLGPLINYAGVLASFEEYARKPIPLLIEVRDREAALTSWRTLTVDVANRDKPKG